MESNAQSRLQSFRGDIIAATDANTETTTFCSSLDFRYRLVVGLDIVQARGVSAYHSCIVTVPVYLLSDRQRDSMIDSIDLYQRIGLVRCMVSVFILYIPDGIITKVDCISTYW